MKNKRLVFISLGVLILAAATFLYTLRRRPSPVVPVQPATPPCRTAAPVMKQVTLTLYFADEEALYIRPEKRTLPAPEKPLEFLIIEQLIRGPENPKLGRTIPPEAKLLSLEVKSGIAYVNFSKELQTKHWGGSTGESMTIYSIVNSLTELPYIKEVQLLMEGKIEQSIFGHAITSRPIPRNEQRINKN